MHLVCPSCGTTNRIPDERLRDEPVCGRHNIRSIPTLILFRGGGEVARLSGPVPAAQLMAWIQPHLRAGAA